MKNFFERVGLFALVIFSFFGTHQIAAIIVNSDDIMQEINDVSNQYIKEPVDAIIKDNTIIPGISGSIVDVKKSYKKMKKVGKFNDSLLVYKEVIPTVSVKNQYDKYIINGNKSKKEVGLIFLINNNDNINNVLEVLKNNKATFFIDGYWFENNNDKINDLIKKGYTIGNLGYNFDYTNNGVAWMNTIITKIGKQNATYCYTDKINQDLLNICTYNKSYTILPNIIIKDDIFTNIKKSISNGSIISLEVNDNNLKQLPLVLSFINSKGFDIVSIEDMLNE